jgi:hypothetical protein
MSFHPKHPATNKAMRSFATELLCFHGLLCSDKVLGHIADYAGARAVNVKDEKK